MTNLNILSEHQRNRLQVLSHSQHAHRGRNVDHEGFVYFYLLDQQTPENEESYSYRRVAVLTAWTLCLGSLALGTLAFGIFLTIQSSSIKVNHDKPIVCASIRSHRRDFNPSSDCYLRDGLMLVLLGTLGLAGTFAFGRIVIRELQEYH